MSALAAIPPATRFEFRPVTDIETIRRVMTDPHIYPHITDDGAPPREQFQPTLSPSFVYLGAWDGEELLGIWLLTERNSVTFEVHTMLLPGAYGERGAAAAKAAIRWIWKNTGCQRLITEVPTNNTLAYRFAIKAGFKAFGRNQGAWMKGGELHDLILLGLSRPGNGAGESRRQPAWVMED